MSSPVVSLSVPPNVEKALKDFVAAAQNAFGADLRSVVLYGSAAEGKLRATSDVNVALVLRAFTPKQADALRDALRMAQAAIQLRPMYLMENEIMDAANAFAQKFDDIGHRRQVLLGDDVFAGLQIPRSAIRARVMQTTLNLAMRLRAGYVARGSRAEQLTQLAADAAGPLRAAAASLLELEGQPAPSTKEALARLAASVGEPAETLTNLSQIRETRQMDVNGIVPLIFRLIDLSQKIHARAERIK